jgi:hypothetical protein
MGTKMQLEEVYERLSQLSDFSLGNNIYLLIKLPPIILPRCIFFFFRSRNYFYSIP